MPSSPDHETTREIDRLAGELDELVRAEKPVPRLAWQRRLDGRVAAGFPHGRRRLPRPRLRVWSPALGLGAAALVTVIVVLSPDTDSPSGEGAGGGMARPSALEQAPGGVDESLPAPGPTVPTPPPVSAPRRVERATQLFLGVPENRMQATAQRVVSTSAASGGVVLSSTVSSGTAADATFELRFPSGRVDRAVARLAALGKVRSQTSTSRDVTRGFLTARERLDGARAERAGLLRALARADTGTEVDALRRRLRLADGEVRSARAALARVRAASDFSRVSLQLSEDRREDGADGGAGGPWSPGDALDDAGRILAVAAGIGVLVLACLVPLALLGAVVALPARVLRRRRREAALA